MHQDRRNSLILDMCLKLIFRESTKETKGIDSVNRVVLHNIGMNGHPGIAGHLCSWKIRFEDRISHSDHWADAANVQPQGESIVQSPSVIVLTGVRLV